MAEEDNIPNNRCGFNLDVPLSADLHKWHEHTSAVCCWRKTWRDNDYCVWHTKVKDKPLKWLVAARTDGPERLDGAFLVGVRAGNVLSFRDCGLRSAEFSNGKFRSVQFQNADLADTQFHDTNLRFADFHDANLYFAEFHDSVFYDTNFRNTNLEYAKFYNTQLTTTEFHDANLKSADFHDSRLLGTQFHNANLSLAKFHEIISYKAEFHNANLRETEFHNANLRYTEFHSADLTSAAFPDTNLSHTEFCDADLTSVDYTDSDARSTDFTHAILHDALLTRADCRGTTFTSAFLYETVFSDTRINSQTTFYDSTTSRPAVVYEEDPLPVDNLPEDTHPLEAAEWVYRRLEKLHDENALSEQAREYHISKEEARRKYQYESEEYARYAVSTLQWYVTGHGESIPRIFRSAAVLILVCGGLYPFVGGFESNSAGAAYRLHPFSVEFSRAAIGDTIATVLQSIYFSVITFTTIGYGDLYPTGAGSKILVGFESLSGAILIALFVFVLGRRVAR